MVNAWIISLVGALLGSTLAWDEYEYVTTTIPYVGSMWTTTTLPECHGTKTVVVETPLCDCEHTTLKPTSSKPPKSKPTKPTITSASTSSSTSSMSRQPTGGNTIVPCVNVNPLCKPEGFNVDYYANPFCGYSSGSIQSNYYIVDHLKPLGSSLTNLTYYPENTFPTNEQPIYPNSTVSGAPYYPGVTRVTNGGITVDANNFTMVYYGYFKAPATGVYQLCTSADNEDDLYFGDNNAFSCLSGSTGTAANYVLTSNGANEVNAFNCANFTLVQDQFYPIRNVAGNWAGPSAFDFTYLAPGAASALNNFTGYAYPQSCGVVART